jgi:hypothetical protein
VDGTAVKPVIQVDLTYGGMYAGTSFDISPQVADHFNAVARRANGMLEGEWVDLTPGLKTSFACPTVPMTRADFIRAWNRLHVVLDGELEIWLHDHPRLFSAHPDDLELYRGVPTYVPRDVFPAGFHGRPHTLELFQDDTRIFGPVERFFHTETSGAVFNQIEDAPGKLVLEVRGDLKVLALKGEIVFFTDPIFGVPDGVTQINDDGSSVRLDWTMLGHDRTGDVVTFYEWVATGVQARGSSIVVEVTFPGRGTGLAAALYSGHTRDAAFRADASVL